jgi:hypothetical protein
MNELEDNMDPPAKLNTAEKPRKDLKLPVF